MLKFQSRNLNTPKCSSLHGRDETMHRRLSSSQTLKRALQSFISNTPDQPIHQLLKGLQLIPHKCTMVLQWIPAHCGILGNERADRLAKSGSKQLQLLSTSTYQEAKNRAPEQSKMPMEKGHWRLQPLYRPNQPSGKTLADHCIQFANRTL